MSCERDIDNVQNMAGNHGENIVTKKTGTRADCFQCD